jgi:hypothetical protein
MGNWYHHLTQPIEVAFREQHYEVVEYLRQYTPEFDETIPDENSSDEEAMTEEQLMELISQAEQLHGIEGLEIDAEDVSSSDDDNEEGPDN